MTLFTFILILLIGAYVAGLLGSLTGFGGGVIIIPLLTMVLGVDFQYAIGGALVASIATSSGSGVVYVRQGMTNVRLGMFLEIATAIGAVCGAFVAVWLNNNVIAVIFGVVLLFSAFNQQRKKQDHLCTEGSSLAKKLQLYGTFPQKSGALQSYEITNVVGGFGLMTIAGMLSGILGIGSGALKVLAMDELMRVPFKVSTTTSNFMMGVTAAASAVIYIQRGNINPTIAGAVLLGVLAGSMTGAQLLKRLDVRLLRKLFAILITLVAFNMIYNGWQQLF